MRQHRELLRDGRHPLVLTKVGRATLRQPELPQPQQLLQDGLFDAELVKLGSDLVDHVGHDGPVHGRLFEKRTPEAGKEVQGGVIVTRDERTTACERSKTPE